MAQVCTIMSDLGGHPSWCWLKLFAQLQNKFQLFDLRAYGRESAFVMAYCPSLQEEVEQQDEDDAGCIHTLPCGQAANIHAGVLC
ncbi:hypothetical protein CFC21_099936 [Triticum aestivum]|uniref:Uncharacterized protein n=2 Tax=Triticum aestivum TaxID=4565 RepID=A0A9R1LZY5_WHEAT|nr:hypothetical protein CFC21_099936 [Triticum aestivum]